MVGTVYRRQQVGIQKKIGGHQQQVLVLQTAVDIGLLTVDKK